MGRRWKMPVCGNGIVEAGEDCDCGLNKSCISVEACCNPRTCKFYPGAECLSGGCCSGCKLLPSDYICRASRNACDVPEYCNGTSAQCPDDDNHLDGSTCDENSGTCFHGVCAGAQQQCVDLWGAGAKVAHESCYTNFNPSGSMTGHCGYDSRLNKYIPCFDNDVKCGLLHCEGGMPYPTQASSNFMIFHVNTREGSFECKSVSSPLQSVLVNDGNLCGQSSFCQNNTCIPQLSKKSCDPQKTCSGNGICTNLDLCYCNPSWKGKDCSIYDFKDSDIYSPNRALPFATDSISPITFIGIAMSTFLLFLLCILISCLFRSKNRRHRRKSHELTVLHQSKTVEPQVIINPSDLESNRTQLLPQFHPSPSNPTPQCTPLLLHRTPFMTSSRSITSACTGLSYLPSDTPRSIRYTNRKISNNGIFSDSETPRSRPRRSIRHIGSPYLHSNSMRHQQTYATLTLKRQHDSNRSYESTQKIYDDIDKHTPNENLREFIQVLDCLAQEKFGGIKQNEIHFETNPNIPSSPTETNESLTIDSGYQSTKQLMNTDEYAVVVKTKRTNNQYHQRRRSYSSIDQNDSFGT